MEENTLPFWPDLNASSTVVALKKPTHHKLMLQYKILNTVDGIKDFSTYVMGPVSSSVAYAGLD